MVNKVYEEMLLKEKNSNIRNYNFRMIDLGIFEKGEKIDFSKYTYLKKVSEESGKELIDIKNTVTIGKNEYFVIKKPLTIEDKAIIDLYFMENNKDKETEKNIANCEKYLKIIKDVTVFYVFVSVICFIIGIIMLMNLKIL